MFCPRCGYKLDDKAQVCKYCGTRINVVVDSVGGNGSVSSPSADTYNKVETYGNISQSDPPQEDNNIYAILGFIFAFLMPIIGLILSIIGTGKTHYRGLAISGLIISIIAILSIIITLIVLFAVILPAAATIPSYPYL